MLELISVFNQRSQAQECCTFYCQSCGEIIMRNRKLLRVLPLPHENWGALVDEWCCHPNPFANKPLHPQENDCFTGDCFFLVNLRRDLQQPRPEVAPVETRCLSSENHLKMKPKANTKVICKRCKVMLGETVSSETTKFYMTEIIIQPSERNFPIIPRSQFVQSVIAQCLVELSSARSTFRFTLQGHDGKAYILLWLLNSDTLVIEALESSTSIKKFPLLEDLLKADSSSAWNAVKVLYQPCIKSRNAELASSWESDVSVHSLTLPSATCLELLLILSRSNATLPPSLRCMNSFQETEENQLLQGAHLEHTYTHRHESLARPACHPCSLPAPVITGALTIRIIADCPSLLVTVLLLSVHLLNMIARGTHTFPSFKGTEKLGVGSQTMSAKEILSLPLPLERCILIKNTPGIDFPTQVFTPR
ncbi:E3 ubiquitin-protein ligase E3D isoform X2 [Delphinapterus leucas]|uniref:E3 ubiquitin-protein ligase E3D n=1 Tax=Delphinapterus leucas TaxID=9749 RepID=A0A2Y9PJS4_DELLE|nr:E3 ubiquitin-protein ligase E3D isoform X2 [Delphinapterus leucas]